MSSRKLKPILTPERVRELWNYDPITGLLHWRIRPRKRTPAGSVAGSINNHGALNVGYDGRIYSAHRLAWVHFYGEWPHGQIDHQDNCPNHNWISNLRIATPSQNLANRRREVYRNKTGLKGVSYSQERKLFIAQIKKDGKVFFLGRFATAHEAHAVYVQKATELFGEFANDGSLSTTGTRSRKYNRLS